jgi:hypothetical protein
VLGQLDFPMIGIAPNGLVVYANQYAQSALDTKDPLLGNSAAQVLPGALALWVGATKRRETRWQSAKAVYRVLLLPLTLSGYEGGTLLVLLPDAEIADV